MFDLLGTERKIQAMKDARKRALELRDMAFETTLQSNNFLRRLGVMNEKEYWKWRLPFDMQRYGITM